MNNPPKNHLSAISRVACYLKINYIYFKKIFYLCALKSKPLKIGLLP